MRLKLKPVPELIIKAGGVLHLFSIRVGVSTLVVSKWFRVRIRCMRGRRFLEGIYTVPKRLSDPRAGSPRVRQLPQRRDASLQLIRWFSKKNYQLDYCFCSKYRKNFYDTLITFLSSILREIIRTIRRERSPP